MTEDEMAGWHHRVMAKDREAWHAASLGVAKNWTRLSESTSSGLQVISQLNKYLIPQSKNESEVAQLCLTLCDPMYCGLPGFSVHGIFPGKSTGVGCHCVLQNAPGVALKSWLLGQRVSP